MNVRSIVGNTTAVLEHIADMKCDICLIQETFLREASQAKLQEIRDYGWNILSDPRKHRTGGGIGVLFRDYIRMKANEKITKFKSFQVMETILYGFSEEVRFSNIYRPPYTKKARFTEAMFLEEFEEYLDDVVGKPGMLFMGGDFNFHMERPDDLYPKKLLELLADNNLFQCVPLIPTHEEGGTLDLFIMGPEAKDLAKDITVTPGGTPSDHHLVSLDFDIKRVSHIKSPNIMEYRDFSSIDIEAFKEDVKLSDLGAKSFDCGVDEAVSLYNEVLTSLMDKHCPVKKRTIKKKYAPWIGEELQNLRRKRRRAERAKNKGTGSKEVYKTLCREFSALEFVERCKYKKASLKKSAGDTKSLYKKLNRLLGKSNSVLPNSENMDKLAEEFKEFFSNKVETIRESIIEEASLNTDDYPTDDISSTEKVIPPLDSFQIPSLEDIVTLVKDLPNKFCSLDPIPTFLLKACIDDIAPILWYIVSESLKNAEDPSDFKKAIIKPTLKKDNLDSDILKNYRPVSNLSVASKLLEKVVLDQLNAHIEVHKLHSSMQSGYRAMHSCETLLVKMVDDIRFEIDIGRIVVVMLLDLSAAFDTIDHDVLLKKLLHDFGVTGSALRWFESYLKGRSFCVKTGSALSSFLELIFGVPQGSLLGPILFILYIKDIQRIAERHGLQIKLYADDTQLYISFHPKSPAEYHDLVTKAESCLADIKEWMTKNFMKLNESKTELLIIGKPLVLKSNSFDLSLSVGSAVVKPTEIKSETWISLGVKLDNSLTMERQINSVKQKCYFTLNNMRTIRFYLDTETKIMMVKQLIIMRLDNCNALYINLPKKRLKKLHSILNSCIRFIYSIKDLQLDLIHLYKESHILPVHLRINFKVCLICFKIINGLAPQYLEGLVTLDIPNNARPGTRTKPFHDRYRLNVLPLPKTLIGSRRFAYNGPIIWNQLPLFIRSMSNCDDFKRALKTHLFNTLPSP